MNRTLLPFCFALLATTASHAQFAPAVGVPGTTAMHKDSSAFIGWATGCNVTRGWVKIDSVDGGYVSAGDSTMVLGPAGGGTVVSLGDGGVAICRFVPAIRNGAGFDFAVFENAFNDTFLELAFVEVSSDGINYFRFPATSYTQNTVQLDNDAIMDPTKINNLAGKYRGMYGTPFDLDELSGISGLDVSNVGYVKIIDVVGNIDQTYATHDQYGNTINDPWPTPFPTGGFDLDGIGVINNTLNGISEAGENPFAIYPNPCQDVLFFTGNIQPEQVNIFDVNGVMVLEKKPVGQPAIDISCLQTGVYILSVKINGQQYHQRLLVN